MNSAPYAVINSLGLKKTILASKPKKFDNFKKIMRKSKRCGRDWRNSWNKYLYLAKNAPYSSDSGLKKLEEFVVDDLDRMWDNGAGKDRKQSRF